MPADAARVPASGGDDDTVLYPSRCYRALAPAYIAAACAAHGAAAPSPAARYRYCEVGCGTGLTLAVLAAANPEARFTGIEHDPAHARRAAALAADLGLSNLRIVEADIADFARLSLPRFDFIAAHGLYSWVPEPVRAALRDFLVDRLAAGGIVYLSYNALPGWNGVLPLREWMQRRVAGMEGPLASRAARARDELLALLAERTPFFTDTPVAAAVAAGLRDAEPGYIVHEYLLPGWQALSFDEVHDAMAGVGLAFVGDAELPGRAVPCSAHAACRALDGEGDTLAVERERDFLHNRFFRRDLYRRAGESATAELDELLLAPLVSAAALGEGCADVDPMVVAGLRAKVLPGVQGYAALRASAPLCALPPDAVRATMLALVGHAQLAPAARRTPPAACDRTALGRVNRELVDRFGLLASPLVGGVIAPHATGLAWLRGESDAPAQTDLLASLAALPADCRNGGGVRGRAAAAGP